MSSLACIQMLTHRSIERLRGERSWRSRVYEVIQLDDSLQILYAIVMCADRPYFCPMCEHSYSDNINGIILALT